MNLKENINRIKEMMGLNENGFLKRRVSLKQLDDSFNESLSYWILNTQERIKRGDNRTPLLGNMIHAVISMTIDAIHPELIYDREEFPYEDIFHSLTDRYFNQMEQAYKDNFPT